MNRKLKKTGKKAFLLLLLTAAASTAFPMEIKTEKAELEFGITIVPEFYLAVPSMNHFFRLDSAALNLEGEYKDRLSFRFDFDLADLMNNTDPDYTGIPENVYFQYRFMKELKLRAGLFRLPVSESLFLGRFERPQSDHFFAARQLAPGRNLGLMIHGKGVFGLFGYDFGLFNSIPLAEIAKAQSDLALAAKLFIKSDIGKRMKVKAGYSAYYSFSEIFTHTAFAEAVLKANKKHTLHVFAEYLEQRYYNYWWNNAVSAFLAWRIAFFEVYFSFEFYDWNTSAASADDRIILSPGFNFYTEKDHLQVGIQYQAEQKHERKFTHEITIFTIFRF